MPAKYVEAAAGLGLNTSQILWSVIVLVTPNLGQARRVADWVTCLSVRDGAGEIAGSGCCADILADQQDEEGASCS